MFHRWHLIIDGVTTDVTDDVSNWDDIKLTLKRGDYDGVVRAYSEVFEFVKTARDVLKAEFKKNEAFSSATIVFLLRNDNWIFEEQFRSPLDFSEYEDDGMVVSLGTLDTDLNKIIKSKGSTEYEFDAGYLSGVNIEYDGLSLEQTVRWAIQGASQTDGSVKYTMESNNVGGLPPVYITDNGEAIYQQKITVDDQKELYGGTLSYSPLITVNEATTASMVIKFTYMVPTTSGRTPSFRFVYPVDGYFSGVVQSATMTADGQWHDLSMTIPSSSFTVGQTYYIYISAASNNGALDMYFKDMDIALTWNDASGATYSIPAITPEFVLQYVLNKMTGRGITISIDKTHDTRLDGTYIVPAESIRGLEGAKLYTSFNKFRDWMKAVFGYVYEVGDNSVSFKHRSAYFTSDVVKTFNKSQVSNYSYHLSQGLLYSTVKAGYDDQTYEVVNGRDEFRFGIEFTTGVIVSENTIELKSPYRCDSYGVELLASKRGEDTTDNSSDKDVFFIKTVLENSLIIPDRTVSATGLISESTQFNLMFSPRRCILANIEYLSACMQVGRSLTFASSEGNSDVAIEGVAESDEIVITSENRIFKAGLHAFEVPIQTFPDISTGLVEFYFDGETKIGYINDLDVNCGKEKTVEYQLIEKGD